MDCRATAMCGQIALRFNQLIGRLACDFSSTRIHGMARGLLHPVHASQATEN
jgi:hypothetical protein